MTTDHERFIMWVMGKLFSARFLALVALVATFCAITFNIVDSYTSFLAKGADMPPGAKEVMLIIIGAFISTINTVIAFYFLRNDRTGVPEVKPTELTK
jgi:purine-cytosine permease-like protein